MCAVAHTRVAADWLERNAWALDGNVDIPVAATARMDRVKEWARRAAEEEDVMYYQLRDATLFDFQSEADILLFIKLLNDGLNIAANSCLDGCEYIANNAHPFQ